MTVAIIPPMTKNPKINPTVKPITSALLLADFAGSTSSYDF
jgi:hypothetical protein